MRLRLLALFTLVFVLLYGSADFLTSLHSWRWPMPASPWPFWPDWSVVYLSLDALFLVCFALVARSRLGALTSTLILSTALAWPLFLAFPLQSLPRPLSAESLGATFELADGMNLDANYFPSLHVAYAMICAAFLARPWAWIWSLAIVVSTLVTHQHYTIDVLAGVALAHLSFRWVTGRARVEALCLGELARCAERHRRYALIGAALYAVSLSSPRRRRLARVGFCYLQHLDDLLDGHLASLEEPEKVASAHQAALLEGERLEGDLGEMGAALREELLARGQGLDWAVEVIEEMKLDRRRVRDEVLLEEAELDRHLERTFELSLDLMLLAADSPLRSGQVPHLVRALAWCSVVRDYHEDQALGLINVPRERWLGGTGDEWLAERRLAVLGTLREATIELEALRGQAGFGLLNLFLRSVKRYARDGKATGGSRGTSPP